MDTLRAYAQALGTGAANTPDAPAASQTWDMAGTLAQLGDDRGRSAVSHQRGDHQTRAGRRIARAWIRVDEHKVLEAASGQRDGGDRRPGQPDRLALQDLLCSTPHPNAVGREQRAPPDEPRP